MNYPELFLAASNLNQTLFAQITNCGLNTDPQTNNCQTTLPMVQLNATTIGNALRILFGVLGFVALVYIILAGFALVTSQGDSQSIAKARNTIIYAGVGLAIVFSAEAVITLVMGRL